MADPNFNQYANWFRNTSPYINSHRGRTFVIHLASEALNSPNLGEIIADLALLNSLGVRLVITFGAAYQAQQALAAQGLDWQEHQGRLIVDQARLATLVACVSSLRAELEARLSMGLANSPMQGSALKVMSGNLITARPLGVIEGVDMHFSGSLRKIQLSSLENLLAQGYLVLLPPLGYSSTGETFDLNAEEVASAVASQLKADKLILFGQEDGVTNAQGQLIRNLNLQEAQTLLPSYAPSSQTYKHLQTACQASQAGVARSHILSYLSQGALIQELFTRDGHGTLITKFNYENLRQAAIEDVGGLLALLAPLEAAGVLVRRSRELLEAEIERFTLISLDDSIIACAALYPYPEAHKAELACVVVHPEYRHSQRGNHLLASIEQQARDQGIRELFVLTTQTAHWFLEQGFMPATVEQLPATRQALYNWQRNSKVFCKQLF